MTYTKILGNRTGQRYMMRPDQVKNNAGGFVFETSPMDTLDRFLILGSESPTYYASAKDLTVKNVQCLDRLLKSQGLETVAHIVRISQSGRAPKNVTAVFALAYASVHGTAETKKAAYEALPKVCRIGTDLFAFAEMRKDLGGGSGAGARKAFASWYNSRSDDDLVYQLIKYQGRQTAGSGSRWTHRDVLRKYHVTPGSPVRSAAIRWAVDPTNLGTRTVLRKSRKASRVDIYERVELPARIEAFERLKQTKSVPEAVQLVREHNLPRACVPTELLNSPEIWEALLYAGGGMPMHAMVRNLAKMTSVGLLMPFSKASKYVVSVLSDKERIQRSKLHPVDALKALLTYRSGHGMRGSLSWTPVSTIADALEGAFYSGFHSVVPTGKNWYLAVDCSGSMGGGNIAGVPGFTPYVGAAVMAMLMARTEPNHAIMGFSSTLVDLPIRASDTLDAAIDKMHKVVWGATDCALPMIIAESQKLEVDVFCAITDNETWCGRVHPYKALQNYRQAMGRAAKLAVVGMTATDFTIADPNDGGMLDVVGFDAAAAQIMCDFARG